jgi:hypothetical protein
MKDNVPSDTDRNKAVSDSPPMLDEVLAIAPGLEADWSAINATIPAGTLVARAEPGEPPAALGGGGGDEGEPGGEPGGDPAGGSEEDSYIESFNLEDYDEAARPAIEKLQQEWQGNYTRKRQADRAEVQEARREAEQNQALIDGMRDPSTLPHYLRLMGIDPADPTIQEALGIGGTGGPNKELIDMLEDEEPDVETRVEKIERERAEEVQAKRVTEQEDALDELADQELEKIEETWGRKLDDDEDFIIRSRAEAMSGPDGLPDYEAAAAALKGFLGRREQDWAKSRSEAGSSRGAPGGRPGGKAPDLTTEEGRLEAAAAAAERAQASQ